MIGEEMDSAGAAMAAPSRSLRTKDVKTNRSRRRSFADTCRPEEARCQNQLGGKGHTKASA
eukprot:768440-Hanusia_phi.AAC.2